MWELYLNGPLVLSFEPADDFMFYSDGIYQSATPQKNTNNLVENPWERVDHAVLVVGWGEEDGKKYWRIQNSWGIESIPEAADVVEDEQK